MRTIEREIEGYGTARILVNERGRPALIVVPVRLVEDGSADWPRAGQLEPEIEDATGWRLKLGSTRPLPSAKIAVYIVSAAAKLYFDIDYREAQRIWKDGPDARDRRGESNDRFAATGLSAFSYECELRHPYEGHPPGSLLVWLHGHGRTQNVLAISERVGAEVALVELIGSKDLPAFAGALTGDAGPPPLPF